MLILMLGLSTLFFVWSSCLYSFFLLSVLQVVLIFFGSMGICNSVVVAGYLVDEYSVFLSFLTILVMFFSVFFSNGFSNFQFCLVVSTLMSLACCIVFSVNSLLGLYVFYELSLIPIVLIIILWGVYPERSVSSMMLLFYTSMFTLPFLYALWFIYSEFSSFSFIYLSFGLDLNVGWFTTILFLFVFVVKLPVYGLHFWLPMAHVEAPTMGSMILAGVLLKLGGMGLVRCLPLMDVYILASWFLGYLLVFLVYTPIVCGFQSDFKRLVAYSSVSHMMIVPIFLILYSVLGSKGILLVLFIHGLGSPMMFGLVGVVYVIFSTRQLILTRGILLFSPFLSFILIMAFLLNLGVPPLPSFLVEAFFYINTVYMWKWIFIPLFFFGLIPLVYNLQWIGSLIFNHSLGASYSTLNISFFYLLAIFMFFIVSLGLLSVIFYF